MLLDAELAEREFVDVLLDVALAPARPHEARGLDGVEQSQRSLFRRFQRGAPGAFIQGLHGHGHTLESGRTVR